MSFTRRDFLATSAVATVAGAIGKTRFVHAWQQEPPPLVLTDIRRSVGYFTRAGIGGTIGYLNNAKGSVIIDTGVSAAVGQAFLDAFNKKSEQAMILRLINTHYHGDHTGGNLAFKGKARKVVAHANALAHHKTPPGNRKPNAGEQLYADTTLTETLREQAGTEWVRCKYYGNAHTSGDIVVTFEQANVAHVGDLVFNGRHAVIDRPGGAIVRNWMGVLDKVAADHAADTIYIFGHNDSAGKAPIIGGRAELTRMKDYLGALLNLVESEMKAGKTRAQIDAIKDPLKGFEAYGPLSSQVINPVTGELGAK